MAISENSRMVDGFNDELANDIREVFGRTLSREIAFCSPEAFLDHYLPPSSSELIIDLETVLDGLRCDNLLKSRDTSKGQIEYMLEGFHSAHPIDLRATPEGRQANLDCLLAIGNSIQRRLADLPGKKFFLREGGKQQLDSDLPKVKDRVSAFLSEEESGQIVHPNILVPFKIASDAAGTRGVRFFYPRVRAELTLALLEPPRTTVRRKLHDETRYQAQFRDWGVYAISHQPMPLLNLV